MTTIDRYLAALEEFTRCAVTDLGYRGEILTAIELHGPGISLDPREDLEANRRILGATLMTLFARVESLYGEGVDLNRFPFPLYQGQQRSSVAPLREQPEVFAVVVRQTAFTWEAAFYEIAHEAVHFLEPIPNVANNPVATLDEAVAVQFAERMYAEHITAYTGMPPVDSPLRSYRPDNPYNRAFVAAKGLTDNTLHSLRDAFGAFSQAFDAPRMLGLAGDELTTEQANHLASPFNY